MTDKRILESHIRRQMAALQAVLDQKFLPRFAARHISLERELLLLSGIRGAGKTTLAVHRLASENKRFAYLLLPDLRPPTIDEAWLGALMEVLCIVYGDFEWLLLDEAFCVDGWENIVRYFRTMGVSVFAVGSGNPGTSPIEALPGASVLYPLSFSEYCLWHDVDPEPSSPKQLAALRLAFDDFSMRGGLPANQFRKKISLAPTRVVTEILDNDLPADFRKTNLDKIKEMARWLAANSPRAVFYSELAERFGLRSEVTAKKYLGIIKGSALLYPLQKFAFQDKMRDYAERVVAADPAFCQGPDNHQARLKTIVYMQLRRFCERHGYQMHYYGNRDLECDFVLCHEMKMRTIIQVIYDYSDTEAIKEKVASLISLSAATGCRKLFILTDNCHDTIEAKGLNIYVKPAYEFLLDRSHMII